MAASYSLPARFHKLMKPPQDLPLEKAMLKPGGGFLPVLPGLSPDKDKNWPIRLHASHKSIAHLAHACHLLDIVHPNDISALSDADGYGGRRSF